MLFERGKGIVCDDDDGGGGGGAGGAGVGEDTVTSMELVECRRVVRLRFSFMVVVVRWSCIYLD